MLVGNHPDVQARVFGFALSIYIPRALLSVLRTMLSKEVWKNFRGTKNEVGRLREL